MLHRHPSSVTETLRASEGGTANKRGGNNNVACCGIDHDHVEKSMRLTGTQVSVTLTCKMFDRLLGHWEQNVPSSCSHGGIWRAKAEKKIKKGTAADSQLFPAGDLTSTPYDKPLTAFLLSYGQK